MNHPHARLSAPDPKGTESREMVRKRRFPSRSVNDILAVIGVLNSEKAVGKLSMNFGPGGVMQDLVFEEVCHLPS